MPNVMNTEIGDRTRIVGLDDFPHNWLFIEYLLRTLWTSIRSQQKKNNIKILRVLTEKQVRKKIEGQRKERKNEKLAKA